MRRSLLAIALVLSLLALPFGSPAADPATESAEKAAEAWLKLVDLKSYGEAWSAAAPLLQGAVTRDKWTNDLRHLRETMGPLRSRSLESATPASSLPGVPDGHYVVLQFHTVFGHKASALETVTPMQQKDGSWKVAGYYIR